MSESKLILEALNDFITAFNKFDKNEIITNLHFPHATHSDGNDPKVYQNGDSFWEFVFHQLSDMKKLEGWSYSTLDKTDIINETKHTAHVLVEFSRRDSLGKAYGVAGGIWVVTKKNGKWGLQARSVFPKSGKISYLAGQNLSA